MLLTLGGSRSCPKFHPIAAPNESCTRLQIVKPLFVIPPSCLLIHTIQWCRSLKHFWCTYLKPPMIVKTKRWTKKHFKFEEDNYLLMCSSLLNVLVLWCMSHENVILVNIMCDANEISCKIFDHPNMHSILVQKTPIFLGKLWSLYVPLGSSICTSATTTQISPICQKFPILTRFLQGLQVPSGWEHQLYMVRIREVILFMYFMCFFVVNTFLMTLGALISTTLLAFQICPLTTMKIIYLFVACSHTIHNSCEICFHQIFK